MTQLLRVHNFFVSRDGFGAGEGQTSSARSATPTR
jgi:hypothetical protein